MIKYTLKGPTSQERERKRLMSALGENRFPQAILIDGPKGIGKKALALELAKALQCTDSTHRPCGGCFGCRMAANSGATENWIIPLEASEARAKRSEEVSAKSTAKTLEDIKQDYIKEIIKNPYRVDIFSTAAFISVESIRIMTNSFAMKENRVRVIIIAEADRMNEAASNAFLKTLEEVPSNTYFILTTSSRDKMLQTIRSRCMGLHLLPLTNEEVYTETSKVAGEDFDMSLITQDVVGISLGSPGKALYYGPLCEQWNSLAVEFIRRSIKKESTDLFFMLKEASLEEPYVANRFLEVLSFLVADLLRKLGGAALRMPTVTSQIECIGTQIDATALEIALVNIQDTMTRIETRRVTATMCLQTLAIKLFEGFK